MKTFDVRWTTVAGGFAAMLVAAPAVAQESSPGCSWLFKVEADTINLAFPDDSANYWVTRFHSIPGSRLVVRGEFPEARYISFHVYDDATRPLDGVADFELNPDDGNVNPFRDPEAEGARAYTVYVEFTPEPDEPAPNTLYAGELFVEDPVGPQQNPAGLVIYRVHVADDPDDVKGGVPLPEVSIELTDGVEIPLGQCDSPPPSTGAPLTSFIQEANFPDEVPRLGVFPLGSENPRFNVFYGLAGDRGGFFQSIHISYMTLLCVA